MFRKRVIIPSLKNSIIFFFIILISIFATCILIIDVAANNKKTKFYASLAANEAANQLILNYENCFDSMFDTFTYLEGELLNCKDYPNEKIVFENTKNSRKDILNISLCDIEGNYILSTGQTYIGNFSEIKKTFSSIDYYSFSSPYLNAGVYSIAFGKPILYFTNEIQKYGILLIECSFQNIVNASNSIDLGNGGFIYILDSDDKIVYSINESYDENYKNEIINKINDIIIGSELVHFNKENYIFYTQTLFGTRWRVAAGINVNDFFTSIRMYNITLFVLIGVVIIISIILASIISNRVSKPLSRLEKTMKEVENGNFDIKCEINPNSQIEVVSLTNSFNAMIDEIKELMKRIVEEQNEKAKSELKALQNQINPHFLYNTLDSIVSLAECNRTDDVKKMVMALAKYFRISISKGKNIITVEEELEHAKNYMIIQSIRYTNTFRFEINVENECKGLPCMKLMLQPFIENSIYHGIKNLADEGVISINVYLKDDFIYFEIIDNGYGMKQSKIDELYLNMRNKEIKNSVGIKNVYQRLKIYYGDEADIIIESELDEYSKFTIKTPIKMEGELK